MCRHKCYPHGLVTAPVAFSIVGATVVLGTLASIAIIRANRRKAYRAWPKPLRVAWYSGCLVLIAFGAAGLINDYVNDWGWQAALWLLAVPLLYGVWHGVTGHQTP